MKVIHHKKTILLVIIVLLHVLISGIGLYTSAYLLTITTYYLPATNLSTSLRILQLTDLHNSEFGEDNSRLVSAVRAQSPDLILLTGDLLNSNEQRTDVATDLITQLCDTVRMVIMRLNIRKITAWMWTSCTGKRGQ